MGVGQSHRRVFEPGLKNYVYRFFFQIFYLFFLATDDVNVKFVLLSKITLKLARFFH